MGQLAYPGATVDQATLDELHFHIGSAALVYYEPTDVLRELAAYPVHASTALVLSAYPVVSQESQKNR